MYVIGVYYKDESVGYVSMVNYKKDLWDSGGKPKVFKTIESVEKAKTQVLKYARAIELKTFKLHSI